MLTYYDERVPQYEEAYTLGTGTASILDPEMFKAEARVLSGIVGQIAHGRLMDLACGTAYWMSYYASSCSRITLFDQSERMLAESRAKANRLGFSTGVCSSKAISSIKNSSRTSTTPCWSASC